MDVTPGGALRISMGSPNPLTSMLDAVLGVLSPSSVVAIASDKGQKAAHERFQQVEHFQVGKRRVAILRPIWDDPRARKTHDKSDYR